MDIFAHFLWNYIIFHRTKVVGKAVLAGVLPDVFSWGIYSGYHVLNGYAFRQFSIALIPDWVFMLYGVTHSLVIFGAVCLILWLTIKRIPLYLYGWLAHILIDIPTHAKDFLPTPFLWPLSSFAFPGIRWSNQNFMIANYVAILLCLGYIFWKKLVHNGIKKKSK
ncbi:hypothetical protein HY488_03240 [Candidatus Woesearchaeota archaeon]|nr:hypothetical protein [Candidatus Woesearchaeota archaeon]